MGLSTRYNRIFSRGLGVLPDFRRGWGYSHFEARLQKRLRSSTVVLTTNDKSLHISGKVTVFLKYMWLHEWEHAWLHVRWHEQERCRCACRCALKYVQGCVQSCSWVSAWVHTRTLTFVRPLVRGAFCAALITFDFHSRTICANIKIDFLAFWG